MDLIAEEKGKLTEDDVVVWGGDFVLVLSLRLLYGAFPDAIWASVM